jgi:hypothetical protein
VSLVTCHLSQLVHLLYVWLWLFLLLWFFFFFFPFLLAWRRFSLVGAVNSELGRFVCDLSHVRLGLVRVGIRMSIDYEFAVTGLGRVWVPAMGTRSGVMSLAV